MIPELRTRIQIARTTQYGDIMRTALLGLAATAAIIGFGAEGIGLPLTILIIAITAFGAIGGAAALDDISALRSDMDEATSTSHYGKTVKARNLDLLKTLTMALIGATGVAEILALWFG